MSAEAAWGNSQIFVDGKPLVEIKPEPSPWEKIFAEIHRNQAVKRRLGIQDENRRKA